MNKEQFEKFKDYKVKIVFNTGKIVTGYIVETPDRNSKTDTKFSLVDEIDYEEFYKSKIGQTKARRKFVFRFSVSSIAAIVQIDYAEVIEQIRLLANLIENNNSQPRKDVFREVRKLIVANFGLQSPLIEDFNRRWRLFPETKFQGHKADLLNEKLIKPYRQKLKDFLDELEVLLDERTNYPIEEEYFDPSDNSSVLNGVPDFTSERHLRKVEAGSRDFKAKAKKQKSEIHVFIASPGDVKEAREDLLDRLETRFRKLYEKACGMRLIVKGWEDLPSQTGHPQSLINHRLVKKADYIVAIFKYSLGTPVIDPNTGQERSESGTAEELMYAIQKSSSSKTFPRGMAYFDQNGPAFPLESIDYEKRVEEYKRLREFRTKISDKVLYKTYEKEKDLLNIVCSDLYGNILQDFPRKTGKRIQFLN